MRKNEIEKQKMKRCSYSKPNQSNLRMGSCTKLACFCGFYQVSSMETNTNIELLQLFTALYYCRGNNKTAFQLWGWKDVHGGCPLMQCTGASQDLQMS